MVILNFSRIDVKVGIYKSRNFMVILNCYDPDNIRLIYKSRNFMVILNNLENNEYDLSTKVEILW